ncbi:protein MNN4-like [Anneissia japonica]|uniref:protein MNN4-like n=1 Tax=Anneissia japonica TaxID=1529436 RepID=UPI001425AFE7|nr:protein MNN4-like [Anneissia japonica]
MEAVHGDLFSKRQWEKFLKNRAVPGSGISFAEIEVDLCNIPSREDIALEQFEAKQEKDERLLKHIEKKLADEKSKAEMLLQQEEENKLAEEKARQKRAEEQKRKQKEEEKLKTEMNEKLKRKEEEGKCCTDRMQFFNFICQIPGIFSTEERVH